MSPTSFIQIRKTLFCVARSIARRREPAKEGGDSKACSAEVSAYDSRWMTASFSSCSELSSSFNSELSSSNSEARKTRGKKRFLIALYPGVGRYVRTSSSKANCGTAVLVCFNAEFRKYFFNYFHVQTRVTFFNFAKIGKNWKEKGR